MRSSSSRGWLLAALLTLGAAARAGDVAVAPSLPERAQALADAARPLPAFEALVDGLHDALPGLSAAGPRAAAEAEIALLQLAELCDELQAWPEAAQALAALRAQAGATVPPGKNISCSSGSNGLSMGMVISR